MTSKMLRSILECVFILIGVNEVAFAGDLWVDPKTLKGLLAREYGDALDHSQSTLPHFVSRFENRSKAQSRFLACGLVEIDNKLVAPVGVLVDRIETGKLLGTRLENDAWATQGEQRAEIEFKYVVDWSFVDLWELQGGSLWREMYAKLDIGHRVGAMQSIYRICQLEPPPEQTVIQRNLLRSIVESDYEAFEKLRKEAGAPDAFPMTIYDGDKHWTFHGTGYTCELVLQFASIAFIEQSFRNDFRKSDACIFTAASVKRPEVFDFIRQLGVSTDVATAMQVTPLHLAAQSGDEYAVRRLLEMQVDVNAQDNGGRTALHKAANARIFSMLLDAGANPRLKTNSRVEPQDAIERHIAEGRIDILEECGSRGLLDPTILSRIREEPSVHERGSTKIQRYEESIGSKTYAVSSSFRAGPVLPLDYIDTESGQIGFVR